MPGLLDAKDLSNGRLGESAVLDQPADLQREACLDLLAFGIGEAQDPKGVAAAFSYSNSALLP
jgi:hypothetical protein